MAGRCNYTVVMTIGSPREARSTEQTRPPQLPYQGSPTASVRNFMNGADARQASA